MNSWKAFAALVFSLPALASVPERSPYPLSKLKGDWDDISTASDGVTPQKCTPGRTQCVFEEKGRIGILLASFESVDHTAGPSDLISLEKARTACETARLAGLEGWRLPSLLEMRWIEREARDGSFKEMLEKESTSYYWTASSHKRLKYSGALKENFNLAVMGESVKAVDRTATLRFVCVRDSAPSRFEDKTFIKSKPLSCLASDADCFFLEAQAEKMWRFNSDAASCETLGNGWATPAAADIKPDIPAFLLKYDIEPSSVFGLWVQGNVITGQPWRWRIDGFKWEDASVDTSQGQGEAGYAASYFYWERRAATDPSQVRTAQMIRDGQVSIDSRNSRDFKAFVERHRREDARKITCVRPVKPNFPPPAPPEPDDDMDGVVNRLDRCPNTPEEKRGNIHHPRSFTADGKPSSPNLWGCAEGEIPSR